MIIVKYFYSLLLHVYFSVHFIVEVITFLYYCLLLSSRGQLCPHH